MNRLSTFLVQTGLLFLALMPLEAAVANEEPAYDVVAQTDDYEIRRYAPMLLAEVDVDPRLGDPGNQAFRLLAGYIFGDNEPQQKMNMTAPVTSRPAGQKMNMTVPVTSVAQQDGLVTYAFYMESQYTLETLPKPRNTRVRLTEKPPVTMAVRRFSGSWSERNTNSQTSALRDALRRDGLDIAGPAIQARYNAPFTPPFLRRNEVMFELAASDDLAR